MYKDFKDYQWCQFVEHSEELLSTLVEFDSLGSFDITDHRRGYTPPINLYPARDEEEHIVETMEMDTRNVACDHIHDEPKSRRWLERHKYAP